MTTRDVAKRWRVRFKTPDGMYTFKDISKGGEPIRIDEAQAWADRQILAHPDRFYEVAKIINLDEE